MTPDDLLNHAARVALTDPELRDQLLGRLLHDDGARESALRLLLGGCSLDTSLRRWLAARPDALPEAGLRRVVLRRLGRLLHVSVGPWRPELGDRLPMGDCEGCGSLGQQRSSGRVLCPGCWDGEQATRQALAAMATLAPEAAERARANALALARGEAEQAPRCDWPGCDQDGQPAGLDDPPHALAYACALHRPG